MNEKWYKKYWNDPVFSKVIATFLVYILMQISILILNIIGLKIENITIAESMKRIIEVSKNNQKNVIIIFLIILLIILIYYRIKEIKTKKKSYILNSISNKDKKWLLDHIVSEPKKYEFLFWFPVNGLMSYDMHNKLSYDEERKIWTSKTFQMLEEKNILSKYLSQFSSSISINNKVYDLLNDYFKENYLPKDNYKEILRLLKNMPFEYLLQGHILFTDYELRE